MYSNFNILELHNSGEILSALTPHIENATNQTSEIVNSRKDCNLERTTKHTGSAPTAYCLHLRQALILRALGLKPFHLKQ